MQIFCGVFISSDCAVLTERKTRLITVFPQLLKIMAKKAWHFWKGEGKSC